MYISVEIWYVVFSLMMKFKNTSQIWVTISHHIVLQEDGKIYII